MTVTVGASENIDQLFDEPWFTGNPLVSNLAVPRKWQVAIAGHGYVIEPSKYQRATVPIQRESRDESVEPGEQTLNPSGAWPRSQDNWFMGAGQRFLDNRFGFISVYTHSGEDPSVRTRFWRSKGINPWNEGELSLLPEQEQKATCGTGALVCTVGAYLYLWDGTNLKVTADPAVASPVWTTITPPAGSGAWPTIEQMDTDGANLYLACGTSGMVTVAEGATAATYMRLTPVAPSVVANGTTGTTSYSYYLVGRDANGFATFVSAVTTITDGNATLTTGNYNEVTWQAVDGVVKWDLLRGDTAHAIAAGLTATSFTDDGSHALTAYTAPTATTQNLQANAAIYGNGFLLGGHGPLLVEVNANGTTVLVMQHFNPAFSWDCGCGSDVAICVAGHAGNVSELYAIQLSTTTYGLGAPYIAGQVSDGEIIHALHYYEGLVIVATSLGVRAMKDTNSDGHLTSGPVIADLGESRCIAVQGPYVWFGLTNFQEADGIWSGTAESSGLGRLYLSQFSTALLPAYTTDALATDGVNGTCTSVTMWGGNPFFVIDGNGLWGNAASGDLVAEGYLEAGWVRFGTVEKKILVSLDVQHDPLPAGASVALEIVPIGEPSFTSAASTETGSTGPGTQWSAGSPVNEAFQMIPILTRGTDPTTGPVLHRWTCRGMVIAIRQDEIIVPIVWADEVESPVREGERLNYDLVAEWDFLKGLEAAGTAFTYQEGDLSYICFIDQIEMDQPTQWNGDFSMLSGVLLVKLLTVG